MLAASETLSPAEREFAVSQLAATRRRFLDAVAGVSEAQAAYRAAPDRWLILECAEHIAVTEHMVPALVRKMLTTPAEPDKRVPAREAKARDLLLVRGLTDRTRKGQAPERVQPASRFQTLQAAVDHYLAGRDAAVDFIQTTSEDLRARFAPHPFIGPLDLYQWYLFVSAHSERHTLQILELKADPGFPH